MYVIMRGDGNGGELFWTGAEWTSQISGAARYPDRNAAAAVLLQMEGDWGATVKEMPSC